MGSRPSQRAENRRWAAQQPGPREFSPESRAITSRYPDLHVRVWCNIRGINLLAYVDHSDERGRLHRTDIAHSTWRGKPPSEEDVVLWATAALSTWLETRVLAMGEAELGA